MGNSMVEQQKLQEAVESYKQSLRQNPGDMDAKYNLEYARRLLKQQQQQQQDQDQQQKDQNKDQKDQQDQKNQQDQQDQNKDQNKDQQDQKNQQDQNKDQNKDQQNQQNPSDAPSGLPRESSGAIDQKDAQRLLEAIQNDEKAVQEKVQRQMNRQTRQLDKNW